MPVLPLKSALQRTRAAQQRAEGSGVGENEVRGTDEARAYRGRYLSCLSGGKAERGVRRQVSPQQ